MDKTLLEKVKDEPLWIAFVLIVGAVFGFEQTPINEALETVIQAVGAIGAVWFTRSRVTPFKKSVT